MFKGKETISTVNIPVGTEDLIDKVIVAQQGALSFMYLQFQGDTADIATTDPHSFIDGDGTKTSKPYTVTQTLSITGSTSLPHDVLAEKVALLKVMLGELESVVLNGSGSFKGYVKHLASSVQMYAGTSKTKEQMLLSLAQSVISYAVGDPNLFVMHSDRYSELIDTSHQVIGVSRLIYPSPLSPVRFRYSRTKVIDICVTDNIQENTIYLLDTSKAKILPYTDFSFYYDQTSQTETDETGTLTGKFTVELSDYLAHGVINDVGT